MIKKAMSFFVGVVLCVGTLWSVGLANTSPRVRVIVIGDSITVGSASHIQHLIPGVAINAKVGRQYSEGLSILRNTNLTGVAVVVMALGTNGPFSQADINETRRLSADRRVVLMTVGGHGVRARVSVNPLINNNRGRVGVIEWGNAVSRDPSLLTGDGVHPNEQGRKVFASLLANQTTVA